MTLTTKVDHDFRWRRVLGVSAAILLAGVLAASYSHPQAVSQKNVLKASLDQSGKQTTQAKVNESVGKLPLAFEPNLGQTDAQVKYVARAKGYTAYLTANETVLRIKGADDAVLAMSLRNAQAAPKMEGQDRQVGQSNYLLGSDRSKWITGVSHFGKVRYQGVYPGVDVVYSGNERQLEYDFVVQPGSDPNQIRIAIAGATKIALNKQGDLEMQTSAGTSVNQKPVVYQQINGSRQSINGEYVLLAQNEVGFKLGDYDRSKTLVIDPTVTVLALIGGAANDEAYGVAVSPNVGNPAVAGVFLTGRTLSINFPTSPQLCAPGTPPGPCLVAPASQPVLQPAHSFTTNYDAFVTKMSVDGTTLIWSTYLGGTGDDAGRAIAVDGNGVSYVAGYTVPIPTAVTGDLLAGVIPAPPARTGLGLAGGYDAFIVKLRADGQAILADTFYGGPGPDQAFAIALDPTTNPNPNVIIGGLTGGGLPGIDGTQKTFGNTATPGNGTTDGFVARFDNNLVLQHATYLGGGGNDQVNGVAVDSTGNVYAAGNTFAGTVNTGAFPTKNGIPLITPLITGNSAAFVVKLNPALGSMTYGTLFGQGLGTNFNAPDTANGIAVDPTGRAYVVGSTGSAFFMVGNTLQAGYPVGSIPVTNGSSQGYLAIFNTTPTAQGSATLTVASLTLQTPISLAVTLTASPVTIGGVTGPNLFNGGSWNAVTADNSQEAYVVGQANLGAAATAGDLELQFVRFNLAGVALSTNVINGPGTDVGTAVAIDPLNDNTFLAGFSTSGVAGLAIGAGAGYKIPDIANLPPATVNAPAGSLGLADALFVGLTFNDLVSTPPTLTFNTSVGVQPPAQFVTVTSSGACAGPTVVAPAFLNVTLFNTVGNNFVYQVQPTVANAATPGSTTGNITFSANGGCAAENTTTIGVTSNVSGPINLVPQQTYILTSALGSGVLQPYTSLGVQTAANQNVNTTVNIATSAGSIQVSASIVNKSANYPTTCTLPLVNNGGATTSTPVVQTPNATAPPSLLNVSVQVNAACAALLQQGVYTATLQYTSNNAIALASLPFSLTIGPPGPVANTPTTVIFGSSTAAQQVSLPLNASVNGQAFNYTVGYVPVNFIGSPLPSQNVTIIGGGSGTVPAGGTGQVIIQVSPTGLAGGVYAGELLASNNGTASGASPQTTVPFIVYVGTGLGLMSPANPTGANISGNAYPITINVPAGYAPGVNGLPNPVLGPPSLQVTGLDHTAANPYAITNPPALSTFVPPLPANAVTVTPSGATCSTFAQQTPAPNSGTGPTCVWNIAVDSTLLTPGTSYVGTLTWNATSTGAANLVAPVTINATQFPQLVVTQPNPLATTVVPGPLGPAFVPVPPAGITLTATAGATTLSCAPLFANSTGALVNGVTIAALPAAYLSLLTVPNGFNAFGFVANAGINPAGSTFAAGPVTVFTTPTGLQVCANPAGVPSRPGTYVSSVTFNGSGIGPQSIPVTFIVSGGSSQANFSQIGVFRPPTPVGAALGVFALDSNGNNAFDATDKFRFFGLAGDTPVAGDWDGTGIVRLAVFRCPAVGVCSWYIDLNNNGQWDGTFGGDAIYSFGLPGDKPVVGDWTGDGKSKIGVMRCPAAGVCTWYLDLGNKHTYDPATVGIYSYGLAGDQPAVGNWAGIVSGGGSPVDQIGIVRCGAGPCFWSVDLNGDGVFQVNEQNVFNFGLTGDIPVVGNWNGNGTTSRKRIGVFRPATGQWVFDTNGNGQFDVTDQFVSFGLPGDLPVVGFWTMP